MVRAAGEDAFKFEGATVMCVRKVISSREKCNFERHCVALMMIDMWSCRRILVDGGDLCQKS